VDDLSAPLGQDTASKRRRPFPATVPQVTAGALGLALLAFVVWTAAVDNPLGGEPAVVVSATPSAADAKGAEAARPPIEIKSGMANMPAAAQPPGAEPAAPSGGKTVTIIDGSSGKRQDVQLPGPSEKAAHAGEARLLETTRHGPVPKVGADGVRPADAYAQPAKVASRPNAPRIALIVTGLGIGTGATAEALAKLPGPVTLAVTPHGADLERLVARARAGGHEVLLQVPMEPFDYPDNDPGPQTLLTSLAAEQNIDRLHWLMSRFQGYVGVANSMGARFSATDQALAPVLREVAKRGLIYVDDGTSPRSLAGQIAGAQTLPFAKGDVVLDTVPTPTEIDQALGRLEALARDRGVAVGIATALPVSIERLAQWAKAAEGRGFLLVPISAAAAKAKSS
jgi:polysaccharide deacetylase 2 family uncharacterized protein YibQ